jgi:two-component system phosphate regulon response regulator OmpR|tara:strand:- start:311 stop:1015 length:705 start_codon:yes stop_codon:yes gene_type:complete
MSIRKDKILDLEKPHILVVDDDTKIRELLKKYLIENNYLVTTAFDANDARAKLMQLQFDLLVLDIMMPGETGLELTNSIKKSVKTPIIFLTAMSEVKDRVSGLEIGADDYLPKPFEPKELLLRIRNVLKRYNSSILNIGSLNFGNIKVDLKRGFLIKKGRNIKLNQSEIKILKVMSSAPGKTFSREKLKQEVGSSLDRTIDVQIKRLRTKIEKNSRYPKYIQTIRGTGYVLWTD